MWFTTIHYSSIADITFGKYSGWILYMGGKMSNFQSSVLPEYLSSVQDKKSLTDNHYSNGYGIHI